jgi:hypothetical protein
MTRPVAGTFLQPSLRMERTFMKSLSSTIACCAALSLCGCSSKPDHPPTFPVTGTVMMKNRPVEGARVIFVPTTEGVEAASGITDADGKFQMTTYESGDGAQAGSFRVKVAKYDTSKGAVVAEDAKPISYEEEQKLQFAPDEKPTPQAKNILPKKYNSETSSGITHTVADGPSTLEIKIE